MAIALENFIMIFFWNALKVFIINSSSLLSFRLENESECFYVANYAESILKFSLFPLSYRSIFNISKYLILIEILFSFYFSKQNFHLYFCYPKTDCYMLKHKRIVGNFCITWIDVIKTIKINPITNRFQRCCVLINLVTYNYKRMLNL